MRSWRAKPSSSQKRARDAGVDVSLHSLPEGQHNFIWGAGRVPEADRAIKEIGGWLRSKLGVTALAASYPQFAGL
jgi:acetyl esterase/lipase